DEAKADGAVIGISGGIDSAVTAYLTVQAIGSRRVLGLIMPDSRITPEEDIDDAVQVAKELGINYKMIDIAQIHSCYTKLLERNKVAEGNLRARIRMSLLYYFANVSNSLVIGTGDRSELLLGYFCYDEKTRAVTADGPKYFHQLRPDDKLYSLDFVSGKMRESHFGKIFTFSYMGAMSVFRSENYSFAVTPNHRMVIKEKRSRRPFFARASDRLVGNLQLPYVDDERELMKAEAIARYHSLQGSNSAERYSGLVWCVSVPQYENFVVERDGRLAVSGNTKYGDGGVDILPIADLYKSEVRSLAEILGVNRRIIQKQSSPRLWESHTAEDELGMAYSKIDKVLSLYFDMKLPLDEAASRAMVEESKAEGLIVRHQRTEHKRNIPRICKIR
ncbi:MAG: NAD(+) synthase, partial [Conexivisphaerales archaeon]